MKEGTNKYLIAAVILALVFHGTTIFFTLEKTYDALIHLFFAEHYASSWFDPWNYKWYTGFTVTSYPPLVHQAIGALSFIGGLKFGLFTVALISVALFVTGAYRFTFMMTAKRKVAGYASLVAVFSSSFLETLHIFGQLPSIIGISVLMHALPEIYQWLKTGRKKYLFTSLSLIAVTVTSHHVTPIFGMIFFIFPLIGMVILDVCYDEVKSYKKIKLSLFIKIFFKQLKRNLTFGFSSLALIILCILPYWINSKKNPITQVPIPHGSRDNFFEVTSSGLVFFIIPWGVLLLLLPYFFYRYFSKRYIFFGLSFTMLFILGTGGTTPIPITILGENAFNILTLDRFTLWASIMALPLFGEFTYRFVEGDLRKRIQISIGAVYHRILAGGFVFLFLGMAIFTMSLGYFRPSQPQKIKMLPIVNFLNQDQHFKWRYLTLGFGDQIAWLAAQTKALSVDGNYHSARRLPELTTRPVERLENAKYQGRAGIGSLQQFLAVPEKYNLKYVFSNDKFYDPILYFSGWQRVKPLENGIMVWEKLNVPPLSSLLPKDYLPTWIKILWGIIPFLTLIIALLFNVQSIFLDSLKARDVLKPKYIIYRVSYKNFSKGLFKFLHFWTAFVIIVFCYGWYIFYVENNAQLSAKNVVEAYYDALDFKEFEKGFSFIDPQENILFEQYMLEISVTDGLLSSYAKLNSIETEVVETSENKKVLEVNTEWITPLKVTKKKEFLTTVKRNGKWYIIPEKLDSDLPPDQLYAVNKTSYFNQGRRRITTEETYHEDVLKQPVLEILDAKLVKIDSKYSIIGEIQNIDNVPADVVLNGTLYNDDNKELANYSAKYHLKHKLMPKEISAFRIDFEGIAWSKTKDSIPDTFNPDEFTPIELSEQPTKFNLQAAGNVSNADLFKNVALSNLTISPKEIHGELFNSGVQEITIPQILYSFYDEDKNLVWVEQQFIKDGVKQQRKIEFNYTIKDIKELKVISNNMENCLVNGLPNQSISDDMLPNRIRNHTHNLLQKINSDIFKFVKIEMNSYIGIPNL